MSALRYIKVHKPRLFYSKALAVVVPIFFLGTATAPAAQDAAENGISSDRREYICPETGELLSDTEILNTVLEYERSSGELPQQFLDQNISNLREYRPSCCTVFREDNPNNRYRSWLSQIFERKYIFVIVGWDDPEVIVPRSMTTYEVSVCGVVTRREGSTAPVENQ